MAFLLSFAEALRYELREQTAKDDPGEVARQGFEALMAGRRTKE